MDIPESTDIIVTLDCVTAGLDQMVINLDSLTGLTELIPTAGASTGEVLILMLSLVAFLLYIFNVGSSNRSQFVREYTKESKTKKKI